MIEEKDFIMRIINKIGVLLRQVLKGQVEQTTEQATEREIDEALSEVTGFSTTMLQSMSSGSIAGLFRKIPDSERVALAGILLVLKSRLAKNDTFALAARELLLGVNERELSQNTREFIASLNERD